MLVFEHSGETRVRGENLSVQSWEPTNSTHIWRQIWESNPDHIGGVLSPLPHPCTPASEMVSFWVSCSSAIQVNELTVINFTWFIFRGLFLYGLLVWKRMLTYPLTQKHKFAWPFSTYREGFNLTNLYLVPFASRLFLIFPTFTCFRNIG